MPARLDTESPLYTNNSNRMQVALAQDLREILQVTNNSLRVKSALTPLRLDNSWKSRGSRIAYIPNFGMAARSLDFDSTDSGGSIDLISVDGQC